MPRRRKERKDRKIVEPSLRKVQCDWERRYLYAYFAEEKERQGKQEKKDASAVRSFETEKEREEDWKRDSAGTFASSFFPPTRPLIVIMCHSAFSSPWELGDETDDLCPRMRECSVCHFLVAEHRVQESFALSRL